VTAAYSGALHVKCDILSQRTYVNIVKSLTLGYKTRGGQSEIYFLTFLELVSRIRNEGPWVWLDYRQDRCLFSTHIVAPCFLTFSHRVRFKTFEGGFDAPRFLSSELFVGIRVDRVRSAPHPGAR